MARFRLEVGPVPLHHQVYADLKASLDSGELGVGQQLPPERELARLYGCSLITIRRALDELSREGRLGRQQGRGTFVLPPRLDRERHDRSVRADRSGMPGMTPDPIMEANERQSEFYAENPRDEEITRKVGFSERWELMLKNMEESQ